MRPARGRRRSGLAARRGADRRIDRVLLRARRRAPGRPRPKPVSDGIAGAIHGELQPGDSALLVMVEQRYAERVVEEFESRGLTLRRQMQGSQCEVALRASIEEVKSKIAWLEELLEHESDKAGWTSGAEKERLESAIRAGRAELAAEQEHLQARLLALRAELETRCSRSRGEPKRKGPVRRWREQRASWRSSGTSRISMKISPFAYWIIWTALPRAPRSFAKEPPGERGCRGGVRGSTPRARSPNAQVPRRPDCHAGILRVPGPPLQGADTIKRQAGKGRNGIDAARSRATTAQRYALLKADIQHFRERIREPGATWPRASGKRGEDFGNRSIRQCREAR